MKKAKALTALMIVAATLAAPSLFADRRHRATTIQWRNELRTVSVDGRIDDIDRERNGFVIEINRSRYRLFAPVNTRVHSTLRNRHMSVRDLERGDVIRATGRADERGRVYVESITILRSEDDRPDRDDRTLRGTVTSIDHRRRIVRVQTNRGNRTVAVDVRRLDRSSRFDLDELRRGDRIIIRGDWQRDGQFEADRIDWR